MYIQNVVVGRQHLSKAQREELDQQVEHSVCDVACLTRYHTANYISPADGSSMWAYRAATRQMGQTDIQTDEQITALHYASVPLGGGMINK